MTWPERLALPKTLLEWGQLCVQAGTVVLGGFAVYQYLDAQSRQRVEATLGYVARYADADSAVGAARRRISATLLQEQDQITRFSANDLPATIQEKLVLSWIARDDLAASLDEVVGFYDELRICVDADICAAASAAAFFGGDAHSLAINFAPYFETRRQTTPDYAAALRAFAAAESEPSRPGR